jgi:hypothetical protein
MAFIKIGGTYISLEDIYGIEIPPTFKSRIPFVVKTSTYYINSSDDEGLQYIKNFLTKDGRFLQLKDKIFIQPKYIMAIDNRSLHFRNGETLVVTSLTNIDKAMTKILSFLEREKDLSKEVESLKQQISILNAKIDELMYIPEGPVAIEAEKSFNELKEQQ